MGLGVVSYFSMFSLRVLAPITHRERVFPFPSSTAKEGEEEEEEEEEEKCAFMSISARLKLILHPNRADFGIYVCRLKVCKKRDERSLKRGHMVMWFAIYLSIYMDGNDWHHWVGRVRVETAQIVHLLTRLCGFTYTSSQLIGITKGESIAGRYKWGWKGGIKGRWVVFIEADVSHIRGRFVYAETCRQLPYSSRAPFRFFIRCFPRLQVLTRCLFE